MTIRFTAAAAALLALSAPASAAKPELTYASVTHCAAFNLLLAQVYSAGDQAAAKTAQADTFASQAAALMVVATAMSDSTTEKVQADVAAANDSMMQSLSSEGAAEKLIGDYMTACDTMGQAAKLTLDKMIAEKK